MNAQLFWTFCQTPLHIKVLTILALEDEEWAQKNWSHILSQSSIIVAEKNTQRRICMHKLGYPRNKIVVYISVKFP